MRGSGHVRRLDGSDGRGLAYKPRRPTFLELECQDRFEHIDLCASHPHLPANTAQPSTQHCRARDRCCIICICPPSARLCHCQPRHSSLAPAVQAPAAGVRRPGIATRLQQHNTDVNRMGATTRNEDLIAPGTALSLHHPGAAEAPR
jgi:hypothetical protein